MSVSVFLRRALLADAVASLATGSLLLLGAEALQPLLALPAGLLRGAGSILVPYAAFVAWLGCRAAPARGLVWAVIAINVLWVADSVLLLLSGRVAPNALGVAFVLAQAAAVAVLAELQLIGLRRARPAVA